MRNYIYTNLTDDELRRLDEAIKRAEFKNRTEYITACAYATIYPGKLSEWLTKITRLVDTSKKHEATFFKLLTEIAYPVIAMKGWEVAANALEDELKNAMYLECGIVLTKPELKRLIKAFESIHYADIQLYRTKIHAEHFSREAA